MTLQELNALDEPKAVEALMKCCGSARWAMAVERRRPFADEKALFAEAGEAWTRCGPDDWREAFSHHPKIGAKKADGWAKGEQSGVASATTSVLEELAAANERYAAKFGFIFIVCATGKSADEMLGLLKARLPNDEKTELKVAAGEQAKITRLRLEKLLSSAHG